MGVLHVIGLIRDMLDINKSDAAKVAELREERFRTILGHAVRRSAFYRDLYRGIDIKTCTVTDLPVVTKQDMMDHFDLFVTDEALKREEIRQWLQDKDNLGRMYKRRFIPIQTSGSTGENALVVYDRAGLDHVHAAFVARNPYPEEPTGWEQLRVLMDNLFFRSSRIALVMMTGGPYPACTASLYTPPLHNLFVKTKIISLLDPVDRIVQALNSFQPSSLLAYASVLEMLAREQLAGRLQISFDRPTSTLASGSEPLSEVTRKLAREAWGVNIQDTYGTAECLVMARSCKRAQRMHVMDDMCILEVVDRHNNPVPAGQVGEKVLVTNLFNYVQPFIRYEISDVTGYATEACDCGWPFPTLLPVEGRTDDIFYIERPDGGYEAIHPTLFMGPLGMRPRAGATRAQGFGPRRRGSPGRARSPAARRGWAAGTPGAGRNRTRPPG